MRKETNENKIIKKASVTIPNPSIRKKMPKLVGVLVKRYGPWEKFSLVIFSFLKFLDVFCAQKTKNVPAIIKIKPIGIVMEELKTFPPKADPPRAEKTKSR